jgi:hypothetical protein
MVRLAAIEVGIPTPEDFPEFSLAVPEIVALDGNVLFDRTNFARSVV